MPAGVFVTIDGPTAEVDVPDPVLRRKVARQLVDAAQPEAWRVELRTTRRPGPVYVAPVEIVDRAGLLDHEDQDPFDAGGPDVEPVLRENTTDTPIPVLSSTASVDEAVEPPPRTGRGSSVPAWRAFLTDRALEWGVEDSRADLIARWDRHNDRSTP
ncbi:hypothetical protein [Nocardia wallacei]|uniref:hypothetical protein n=1 Tax=Nocardia wallacei TaxID=480035 RepID=UPI00245374AE|nr:hypothetical protein [Nocardia wallacei]